MGDPLPMCAPLGPVVTLRRTPPCSLAPPPGAGTMIGVPAVVALNAFPAETVAELDAAFEAALAAGPICVAKTHRSLSHDPHLDPNPRFSVPGAGRRPRRPRGGAPLISLTGTAAWAKIAIMNKLGSTIVVLALALGAGPAAAAPEKLMLYTSMKESLVGKIRDAFSRKHPEVTFDYYSAGAGKLMAKIAAERQSGRMTVDVLWHSEVPDFYQLRKEGILERYLSPEAQSVKSTVSDGDGYFTPARLGTLGIAYNTKLVTKPPTSWQDLLDGRFKGAFGIANPALSGTSFMSIAMLVNTFGWDYVHKLKANGARIGQGSGQVVDDTASGDLKASLAVDYIALDKIGKGATLGFFYPEQMLVIPSPVAIIKGTPNAAAARKLVDFLLSREGQTIIAASGTLPVRSDVPTNKALGLPSTDEAVRRALPLDYQKTIAEKESIIKTFDKTMRAR
jgi:iron(III) transport system substrate-binding protein